MRIEVSRNFSTLYVYNDRQLLSIIDLDENVIEVAGEIMDLLTSLGIDCEGIEID